MSTPTPARLYVPNSAQLTVKINQNGQESAVVLGCIYDAGAGVDAALGKLWLDHFWARFRAHMAASSTCTGGVVRDTSQADGLSFDLAPPTTAGGADAAAGTVAAAALLIRWRTTAGGRSGRGRTFLPGVTQGMVAANGRDVTPGVVTSVTTSATTYVTGFKGATNTTLSPAVLSLTKGTSAPIIAGSCAPILGIQRRRMRG